MKRSIDIYLGDGPQVGRLHFDLRGRRENGAFEYTPEWLAAKERFTLDPTLRVWLALSFTRGLPRAPSSMP